MNLEVATEDQVIEWFESRPEYKELLIQDMRKILGLYSLKEFKFVFDYTDFLIHPVVGLIPSYILENLVDPTFEERADPSDFRRCIWKSLWFCLIQKTNFGEVTDEVVALDDFEKYENDFSIELHQYWTDIEDYLGGWRTTEFSNGKVFVPGSEVIGINFDELKESEVVFEWTSPSGLHDMGHSAHTVVDGNGRIFIHISADGDFLMEVASNEEAITILNEFWG